VLSPCRGADGNAVPGLGVSRHILHIAAEVDLFLTGRAEADVALVGLLQVIPELGTLEPEWDGTVGDGGHSELGARSSPRTPPVRSNEETGGDVRLPN